MPALRPRPAVLGLSFRRQELQRLRPFLRLRRCRRWCCLVRHALRLCCWSGFDPRHRSCLFAAFLGACADRHTRHHPSAFAPPAPGEGRAFVPAMENQGSGRPAQLVMSAKVWQILIAAILGTALLVGLGVWQLQRLAWKEALIAERDARLNSPPVTLDQALKEFDADHPVEFLKVEADGVFQHNAEAFMLTSEGGVPGFEVVTPLQSKEGVVVLVDRGFVPEPLKDAAKRPESQPQGEVKVTG